MIDVAVIASIPHLRDLSALGSIEMALTHLVLTHPGYAAYHRGRATAGVTVILDNSAYELETVTGQGLDAGPVLDAAERVQATIVICQDVLYDGPATVMTTRRFLTDATHRAGDRYRFMAVPQGSARTEWLDCYRELAALDEIDLIGLSKLSVPRCYGGPVAEARLGCTAELLDGEVPKPLHLLGGDRSLPWELREHHRRGHDQVVESNDSSFAYWYAACGISVDAGTGRAQREAASKPELSATRLDERRLDTARSHVSLLRATAGLTELRHQGERHATA